ncbi:helix-turn-helix domain-containing protein [Microbacterium sp.]|uniref:helix-turn-helix domain-containing protein n=1 Tax=Microbacterium sp. TaxID=51671 RepID=UPI0039E2B786
MTPETLAAIDRVEASGVIAEAVAAIRLDPTYCVEIADDAARLKRPTVMSADDVQRFHELRSEGMTMRRIAARFGIAESTLHARLRALAANQTSAVLGGDEISATQ